MEKVYRRQRIEGVTTPAIVNNGKYYYANLAVYEDGIISCWHKSDLEQFKGDLKDKWVLPSIPDNASLSVHGLADLKIKKAHWNYNADEFYEYIKSIVKTLNPEMVNIYSTTQREIDKWKKARVIFMAEPTNCKLGQEYGYELLDGESSFCFYKQDDKLYLTSINAYSDKTLSIDVVNDKYFSLEEIESFFDNDILFTSSNKDEWIYIDGLGEVLVDFSESDNIVRQSEKKKQIMDLVKSTSGEKDSLKICIDAYHQYLTDPTDYNREALRKTYEAVPKHDRMYLGSMDNKDSDYRRILNNPKSKREV